MQTNTDTAQAAPPAPLEEEASATATNTSDVKEEPKQEKAEKDELDGDNDTEDPTGELWLEIIFRVGNIPGFNNYLAFNCNSGFSKLISQLTKQL